ncbi:MAG: Beta propeller domain protein, partial [Candidatus Azambacteria bacterium GW2011_GWE2_46_45]
SALKFIADFFKTKTQDIVPASFIQKLEKLSGYDIGENTKMLEFQTNWQKYLTSLDEDERLKIENELSNRMSQYHKEHKREFEKTGIVKISLDDFNAIATGNAPGRPLNQFALDEYNNHPRRIRLWRRKRE